MPRELKLFVVDTGPLITLAAARALDCLTYVEAQIVIPDAVLYEATADAAKLGAQDIIDWVKSRRVNVEVAPTKAYQVFDAARAAIPGLREANLGERAAIEVIEEPDRLTGEERGVLLCEETAILRRIVVRDRDRVVELSTLDFLNILEAERRIQSADHVFDLAAEAGRRASRVEKLPTLDDPTRDALRDLVRSRDSDLSRSDRTLT